METSQKIPSVSDWMKLPEISIPRLNSDKETGTVLVVKKVGFLAVSEDDCMKAGAPANRIAENKCILPTAVVELDCRVTLLRLPVELAGWVFDCVALANAEQNQFPSKVEFGELNGRVYAQLIHDRAH
jgi:hypothetical protein